MRILPSEPVRSTDSIDVIVKNLWFILLFSAIFFIFSKSLFSHCRLFIFSEPNEIDIKKISDFYWIYWCHCQVIPTLVIFSSFQTFFHSSLLSFQFTLEFWSLFYCPIKMRILPQEPVRSSDSIDVIVKNLELILLFSAIFFIFSKSLFSHCRLFIFSDPSEIHIKQISDFYWFHWCHCQFLSQTVLSSHLILLFTPLSFSFHSILDLWT